jgi:membrane-bound lytic murein transglycosylase F
VNCEFPRRPRPPFGTARLARWALLGLTAWSASACERRLPLSYLRAAAGEVTAPEPALAETEDAPGLADDLLPPIVRDLDSIRARDTLSAVLTFNSTGYFIHRGEPLGYEYELLQAFAEHQGLALKTVVSTDRRDVLRALNRGAGDIVAARLISQPEYAEAVGLTSALYSSRPVVVQRAPGNVAAAMDTAAEVGDSLGGPLAIPDSVAIQARLLSRPSELAGQEVHVPAGSDYYERIVELSDSLGENIELVEVESAEQVEPLIQAVAEGRIRLTVSQENLAELSKGRFSNIVTYPALGAPEPVVWAVRKNSPALLTAINGWLASDEGQALKAQLYSKYFVDSKAYQRRVEDDLFASETGQISAFDTLLAQQAQGIGWDWRLLAAQVAQESRFDPSARSWAGARGLLQLMPRTAREMGVRNPTDPAQNVAGGVRYLARLTELWQDEIPDDAERLKFVLASYNAGRGHVLDAQRLAEKNGDDPLNWDDVAFWLLQKSKPQYYRDRVVQHGYVRGLEPVQYVSRILERYERYRAVRPD